MRKSLLTLTLLMLTAAASAQHECETTANDHNLGQVVVTGTRTPKLLLNSPVQTKVISASDIAKADATNLTGLLQTVLPGVEFSYAMNQQMHLNFGGFGGQSMLILIDGERLAGETMDDVDFSRIDLNNIDHIEIVKGAASALYGSNASGGVINLITKKHTNPFALNLSARYARHNEQRYCANWQQGAKKWSHVFTLQRTTSDNYDVKNADNPQTRVVTTIFGDRTWNAKEQLTFKPNQQLQLTARAGYFFRQMTRNVDQPERYRDFSGGLKGTWQASAKDQFEVAYSFDQYDKSDFQRIAQLDVRDYSNVQNSLRMLYHRNMREQDVFSLGADYLHDYLMNKNLEGNVRKQQSFDLFTQYDWNITDAFEMVGAMRYDYFSDGNISQFTPKFSARYRPSRHCNLRFGYGMGFRAPTLKEKYYNFDMSGIWRIEGNPDLKSEVSHNFNLSTDYTRHHCNLTLGINYNRVRNKIATGTPYFANPTETTPRLPYLNLASYAVFGGEAAIQGKWSNGIMMRVAYAYTNEHIAKDKTGNEVKAPYLPARKHSLTAHIDREHRLTRNYAYSLALDGRFLSGISNDEYKDYYDLSKGSVRIDYPAYTLWKLTLVQHLGKSVRLTLAVDNLLNYRPKHYYLNAPLTDGTNVLLGLSVDVDKIF